VEKEFDVVHVAIEQGSLMVCGKDDWAYLNVTDDTHAPDGVVWTSRPHGIHGHGSSVSFRPSQLVPGAYTVKAANDGTPSCPDVCEVHVIKVNIPTTNIFVCAEDSLASLSLSGDSYSPGGYVWSSTPDGISGCGPDKTITFVPSNLPPGKYVVQCQSVDLEDCLDECEVNVLKVDLVPDWNHDRKIDDTDRGFSDQGQTFSFWKNDDDDSGDLGGNDIPGHGTADAAHSGVDGVRDLVDWFPVFLDMKATLDILDYSQFIFVLTCPSANSLNVIYSDLTPADAGKYLTDQTTANAIVGSTIQAIGANGIQLTTAFLDSIKNDGKGIVLVEAKNVTTQPLRLRILDSVNNEICAKDLPLKITGVEDMYWRVNLRPVIPLENNGNPAITDASNLPGTGLITDKRFVFVHGYSVSESAARGWLSEVFKRTYWSGSLARFYGVTWFGNDSQAWYFASKTPNYHVNVIHALDSAEAFADVLNNDIGGTITLASHSLGNVLSSAAITKHGASVAQFLMLDAAVAIEAFDGDPSEQDDDMWYTDWPSYAEWLWCSEWYTNFPSGDGRHALTWRDTFSPAADVAYNFYSSGEDVLKSHPHTTYPGLWCYFGGEYAWALQEKRKGLNWISSIGGSTYGGWGFNDYYWDNDLSAYVPPTNTQAILSRPFFRPGGSELADLYVPTDTNQTDVGSQYATDHLNFLLAGFIPSRTLPAGANNMSVLLSGHNFNMQTPTFQTGWPASRNNTDWLHSDLRVVAYLYVYRLYDKFRDLGGLNQP
jgi:hypothetical protein